MADNELRIYLESIGIYDTSGLPSLESWHACLAKLGELLQEQYLFQAQFEQTQDAIFILDLRGHVVRANQRAADLFGVPSPADVVEHRSAEGFPTAELADAMDRLQRIMAGEILEPYEHVLRRPDGTKFYAEVNVRLIRDEQGKPLYIQSMTRDITDRKLRDNAMEAQRQHLRLITDNVADSIIHAGMDGITHYISPSFKRLVGYDPDELIGKQIDIWTQLVHPDDLMSIGLALQAMMQEEQPQAREIRAYHRDGHLIHLEAMYSPLLNDGTPEGVLVVWRDISARKQAEDALRQSEERARNLRDQLKVLHEVNLELSRAATLDELTRKVVELGRNRLGLDRVGLWLISESQEKDRWDGTYGTDEQGNLRDERDQHFIYAPDWLNDSHHHIEYYADTALYDHEHRMVGHGWSLVLIIRDIGQPVGMIAVDNLFSQKPMSPDQIEILSLFAATLGHLITRKRSSDALRASEERLRQTLNVVRAGWWDWDVISDVSVWADETYHLLGYEIDPRYTNHVSWMARIHPDDRTAVDTAFHRMLETTGSMDYEARVVWLDGSIHWIHNIGQVIAQHEGKPQRVLGILMDITARKEAEVRLRQHEERLTLAMSAAKAGWWEWNAKNDVIVRSAQTYVLMGYPPGAIPTTIQGSLDMVHPDDHTVVIEAMTESVLNNRICDFEYRVVWPDGSIHWLHNLSHTSYDTGNIPERMVGIVMDITERKRQQDALSRSEQQQRLLTDTMSDCVGQVDMRGNLQYLSPAFEKWTGWDSSKWINKPLTEWLRLICPDDYQTLIAHFTTIIHTDQPLQLEHRIRTANGQTLWFETVATVLRDTAGNFEGAIFVNRNIDERRRAQQDKLDLAAERTVVSSLRNLLANVSHDFRTPLSVINSSLYLLRRKAPEDFAGLRHVSVIEDRVEQMANMVETMFTLSHMDEQTYQMRSTNLTDLVKQSYLRRVEAAERKEVHLTYREWDEPLYIQAEPVMLMRALDHIILNAVQYTPSGGNVRIQVQRQEQTICIEVKDTGIGISPFDLPHIFESFYRADKSRAADKGSTGLGLTIAQKIVQRHNGQIEVESVVGEGSTFRVLLPIASLLQ